jgi:hypothetical protein
MGKDVGLAQNHERRAPSKPEGKALTIPGKLL